MIVVSCFDPWNTSIRISSSGTKSPHRVSEDKQQHATEVGTFPRQVSPSETALQSKTMAELRVADLQNAATH